MASTFAAIAEETGVFLRVFGLDFGDGERVALVVEVEVVAVVELADVTTATAATGSDAVLSVEDAVVSCTATFACGEFGVALSPDERRPLFERVG